MAPGIRQGIAHAGLARAIELMEARLEDLASAAELCRAAGVSQRQLERMFRKHFQLTPWRYYLHLRLQRARALLQYTELAVVQVAVACGFNSAAHFSRTYARWAGKAPSAERAQTHAGVMPSLR
jgi:AraC family carnitine catabolism transcriptional activator